MGAPDPGPTDVSASTDLEAAPLSGVKVVDFTHLVAGPFCTMLLSDAGATVVKIEPPWGDSSRFRGARRDGPDGKHVSGYVVATNRGKKAVVLDLKTDDGRQMALRLIGEADVLIENFAPGVLTRLGLDPARLREQFPRLITASISLYGALDDATPERTGLAIVAEAESGVAARALDDRGRPVPFGVPFGDMASGLTAYAGIVTALHARNSTGRGRHVEVSMVRTLFAFNATAVAGYALAGEAERGITTSPYGYFPTADGFVAIAVNVDPLWTRFCQAIGRPDLAEDSRYAHYSQRDPRVHEVEEIVTGWTRQRPKAEVVETLAGAGVPCGPINTIADILAEPLYRAAGLFTTVSDGMGGTAEVPHNPLGYERAGAEVPQIGQHTVEVFRSLGYSDQELSDLASRGAFGDESAAVARQLGSEAP